MIWAPLVLLAVLVAWAVWMLPLSGPEGGRGFRPWAALDDFHSELKARRLVKEARQELAERREKAGSDA